ncbi:hypothetical protein QYZ88_000720 [Lachnospiraceae bacterium C1.1]|nr:hypothetical protein [Lachnospiraceae bacterium C1.1]
MSNISSVNSVDNIINSSYSGNAKKTEEKVEEKSSALNSDAYVYEKKSDDSDKVTVKNSDRSATIAQLQADAEKQVANLRGIVEKLLMGQSKSYAITATDDETDSIWDHLRKGDFEVDAATKAQAEEDISEDGYWGVDKTSSRIVDFAIALSGNDSSKADKLLEAFKEGYAQAEKTWGGELPEISQKTYDAVLEKFQQWKDGTYTTSDTGTA